MSLITIKEAARLLKENDRFLILTHQSPDGDTLGSGFALFRILSKLGKKARVVCGDAIHKKYSFLYEGIAFEEFEPEFLVTVDVADPVLLGGKYSHLADKVDLNIDHHTSNRLFARKTLLEDSAATAELIYELAKELKVELDKDIAMAIYTGIATDTGCFKFSNTTAKSHLYAAELFDMGIDAAMINNLMFETKSKERLELERKAYEHLEYFFDGRCAVVSIFYDMIDGLGVDEGDLDGLASIPRQIEGVDVGVTIRERQPGIYKISVRTSDSLDASEICAKLGGGGHIRAAGCTVNGSYQQAKDMILSAIDGAMNSQSRF